MADSVDVKIKNLNLIRRVVYKTENCTKQSIVVATGLSSATCNTLLNELEERGEIIGEKKKLTNVGRFTSVYNVNEEYELLLCVMIQQIDNKQLIIYNVVSITGKIIVSSKKNFKDIDNTIIQIKKCTEQYAQISKIIVGVPGSVSGGKIRFCDISEFDGIPLSEIIENKTGIPVYVQNDITFRAYGYYCRHYKTDGVFTFGLFPDHVHPGLMTVYKGNIVKGANGFAGFIGYFKKLDDSFFCNENIEDILFNAIAANIVMVNPDRIVLSGNLVTESVIQNVKDRCINDTSVPSEFLPEIIFEPNVWAYYLEGMIEKAIDLNEQK